jgi:hypothetical protein
MRVLVLATLFLWFPARAQPQPAFPDEPGAEATPVTGPALSEPPPPPRVIWPKPDPAPEPVPRVLEGVRGYVGVSAGFGLALFQGFSAPLAVRAGAWLGKLDLGLEVAPLSDLVLVATSSGRVATVFQVSAGVGYFLPLNERGDFALGWPFRFTLGLYAYDGLGARLSVTLVGLGFRIGKFYLELTVPATVYVAPGQSLLLLALPLNLALSRLF